jgi:hypothetical protein
MTRRIRPGLSQKLVSRKGMAENAKAGKNIIREISEICG